MPQEDLGRRASLHRTEIGLLERAGRVPQIDTLIKLAGALAIEPKALLKGIKWTPETVIPGEFEIGSAER
jgi:transcriptional regulator with XRE-family HTH domain